MGSTIPPGSSAWADEKAKIEVCVWGGGEWRVESGEILLLLLAEVWATYVMDGKATVSRCCL